MRQVALEGTPIRASRLGFGTASLHHLLGTRSRQALLEHAWSQGIRYFDTAPLYGHELAERELGRFARGRRARIVIATKFGLRPDPLFARHPALLYGRLAAGAALRRLVPGMRLRGEPARDYSPAYARARLERSLLILRTDYVDILFLHEPSLRWIENLEGLAAELGRLKAAGQVRQVGISGSPLECAALAMRCPAIAEVMQVEVGPGADAASMQIAGRRPQITFGHFRGAGLGKARSPEDRTKRLEACVARAIALNPTGVILFSTRRPGHLDDLCAALGRIEGGS
jgi:aryl-alcohol dehydrogenase-like predicted oxidoreductase